MLSNMNFFQSFFFFWPSGSEDVNVGEKNGQFHFDYESLIIVITQLEKLCHVRHEGLRFI